MSGQDDRIIGLVSDGAAPSELVRALIGRVESLGWRVVRGGEAGMDTGGMPALWLLDARRQDGVSALPVPQGCGACIAIVDISSAPDEAAAAAMLTAGVTHFLPWPADDALLSLTLSAARAVAARALAGKHADDMAEKEGTDSLTGLASRSAARRWVEARLAPAPSPSPEDGDGEGKAPGDTGLAACLLVGISQFDSVNAAYGKNAGDIVLERAAKRILHCVRQVAGDAALVARMGGTEYLVALPADAAQDEAFARDLARLILSDVAKPFVADETVIRLTARCGIAQPAPGDDAARLLRRAAAALADARRSGTSDICVRKGAHRRGKAHSDLDTLDADLRLALDRGEIGLVYQPQYDSLTDRIIGVEALARWNHPRLGQLDAGTLFEAADRSDYLLPLSRHIQKTALIEAGRWPDTLKPLRLSINVTAGDLAQEDFVASLTGMVAQSGFPQDRLTVELTESGLVENIGRAADILQALRRGGLRVAIDDFGTGYSSLAYLKSLHPDYLKIDHSLSRDILGTPRDRVILRAIIEMARSLALTVIAEGVESEEQLTLLAREGCQIYQGFLRSPAVSSEELVELVAKG